MQTKKRQRRAVVCKVLLASLYIVIFWFSAQNGEDSGAISTSVSQKGIWFLDIPQDTKLSPLLNFAETANRENLRMILNILSEYKNKGNKDAISAYSEIYKKVLGKSVPLKQAVIDILQSHGIKSKADLDKQTDEDGAALYEDLKAGILEEYDITYKKLVSLLNKLVK